MKTSVIDALLVAVIAVSASFVGYRLFRGGAGAGVPQVQSIDKVTSLEKTQRDVGVQEPAPIAPMPRQKNSLARREMSGLLMSMRTFSPQEWQEQKNRPSLSTFGVSQTDACKETPWKRLVGRSILKEEVSSKFRNGDIQFLFELSEKYCIRKNSAISIFSFGHRLDGPVFSYEGIVTVEEIFQIPVDMILTALKPIMNLPEEELSKSMRIIAQAHSSSITLLKISAIHAGTPENREDLPVPRFTAGVTTLRTQGAGKWFLRHRDAVIVDVRSREEAAQTPVRYNGLVLSAPYVVSGDSLSWRFNWDRTVRQVSADDFDVSRVSKLIEGNRPIVFVGAAPFDGRPVWALYEFMKLEVLNIDVVWFYDGASSLNDVIGKH
ncbi:MAG: hypothetical protein IPJ84_03210 [Bdellovibrionales bacterium]|nr:hypothetical protein [Bdellovibrionales bacterium]